MSKLNQDVWTSFTTDNLFHDDRTMLLSYRTALNIWEDFHCVAQKYPDKTAVVFEGDSLWYSDLDDRARRFASGLHHLCKVRKGDIVALLLVNSLEFCIAFYASMYLGAVAVPLSTKLKSGELKYMLGNCKAKVLVANPEWLANVGTSISNGLVNRVVVTGCKIEAASGFLEFDSLYYDLPVEPASVNAGDGAVIMYTSGTTGRSKGAYLTHFNLLQSVASYEHTLKLANYDSTLIAVPIFHITGLAALFLLFMHLGGTVFLQRYFNADQVLDTLKSHNITFLHAVPTIYIMLLEKGRGRIDLPLLRKAACGGGPIAPETILKIKEWLPHVEFHTVYGLTETSSPVSVFPGDAACSPKSGSSGLPIPIAQCRIIDPEGGDVFEGGVGELLVRGGMVIQQYWNNPASTEQSFVDGWFRTGDVARLDHDGYVYILDRLKDMINRGGEKIYSIEVETIIHTHPGIRDVAIIASADPVYGEVARAVVVAEKDGQVTEDQVRDLVREKLAGYKAPKYVDFVDELPRNDNGKIDKKLLRKRYP